MPQPGFERRFHGYPGDGTLSARHILKKGPFDPAFPMHYDTTLKEILQALPQNLLRLLVGQEGAELLNIEVPAVKKRLPDLVVRLMDGSIFHLELQSGPEAMEWRMLEYYAVIRGIYPGVPLRQMVLHVGPGRSRSSSKITEPSLKFCYTVKDIQDIDCRHMLESPLLEENLLAILCHPENNRQTIREILTRMARSSPKNRADTLEKLVILAGLRNLEMQVKEEVENMAISVNVLENAFLRDIFGKGRQEGRQEEAAALLLRQLARRFGELPAWVDEKIANADLDSLETWSLHIFDARSLDELFQYCADGP